MMDFLQTSPSWVIAIFTIVPIAYLVSMIYAVYVFLTAPTSPEEAKENAGCEHLRQQWDRKGTCGFCLDCGQETSIFFFNNGTSAVVSSPKIAEEIRKYLTQDECEIRLPTPSTK